MSFDRPIRQHYLVRLREPRLLSPHLTQSTTGVVLDSRPQEHLVEFRYGDNQTLDILWLPADALQRVQPHLFWDLDGVLADFEKGFIDRFKRHPESLPTEVKWRLVRECPNFYAKLPLMAGALALWDRFKKWEPDISTGCPRGVPTSPDDKRAWVAEHFGSHVRVITGPSEDKSLHLNPGDVLVDDWLKHRDIWLNRGGIFVHYTTPEQTVAELEHLGF